jgi:hypothetical protein
MTLMYPFAVDAALPFAATWNQPKTSSAVMASR